MSVIDQNVIDLAKANGAALTTDDQGNVCIRICGTSVPQGLSEAGRIILVPVVSTGWTQVVITSLDRRRAFAFQNSNGIGGDNNFPILLNYPPFAPGGGAVGWKLEPGDSKFYDADETVNMYVRAVSGSFNIVFEELS